MTVRDEDKLRWLARRLHLLLVDGDELADGAVRRTRVNEEALARGHRSDNVRVRVLVRLGCILNLCDHH